MDSVFDAVCDVQRRKVISVADSCVSAGSLSEIALWIGVVSPVWAQVTTGVSSVVRSYIDGDVDG